jgi:hypothetical protein
MGLGAIRMRSTVALFALIALATCLQCFGLDPRAAISQYAHIPWRIGEHGLDAPPQSIAQTKDGYIWIGTRRQLYRFDGLQFVPLPDPETNVPHVQDTKFLFAASDGACMPVQGPMACSGGRTGGSTSLGTIRATRVHSRKILQGLYGFPPADTKMTVLFAKSLTCRSTVFMRLKVASAAPLPASCWSQVVDVG